MLRCAKQPGAGDLPDAGRSVSVIGRICAWASSNWATSSARCSRACLIGQICDITVDPTVQVVFFALFLFATGYKVGPQFFRGPRAEECARPGRADGRAVRDESAHHCRGCATLGYDSGTAAGLMAGASPNRPSSARPATRSIGSICRRPEKTRLKNNIPVAYAVSYLVGTGFIVWFLSVLAPRLLRVDLKAESRKLATQVLVGGLHLDQSVHLAYKEWSVRAYRLADVARRVEP